LVIFDLIKNIFKIFLSKHGCFLNVFNQIKYHQNQNFKEKPMKKTILFLLIFGMLSCSGSDEETASSASITNVSKLSGEANTTITISGANFGTNLTAVQVFFNGKAATIKSLSNEVMTVIVPVGAFTGNIKIVKEGKEVTGPVFEYILGHTMVSTINTKVFPLESLSDFPSGIAVDAKGNIYVTAQFSRQIKKIDKNGVLSNFAGSYHEQGYIDGQAQLALFNRLDALAVDSKGNVYAADSGNNAIRKITPNGVVSTFADSGKLNGRPYAITIDKQDNVYSSDGAKIMKITPEGVVSLFAGSGECGSADGIGANAGLCGASSITADSNGNLYVLENVNGKIRKITPQGVVTTLAVTTLENGVAVPYQKFKSASYISVDKSNNLYVSIAYDINVILKINPDGNARVLIGGPTGGSADGAIDKASIGLPAGLAFDQEDNLYFTGGSTDAYVRKITKEKQ
jgi:sugar lactone lactonase YvrE